MAENDAERAERRLDVSSREYMHARREHLSCPMCPPNRGENSKRHARHGVRKPRHKNRRTKESRRG